MDRKMYYLFSRIRSLESVYICDGDNYIDHATDRTEVYPLGVMLSKTLKLLEPFHEGARIPLWSAGEEILRDGLSSLSEESPSFPNIGFDDACTQYVLFSLLINGHGFIESDKFERLPELLRVYTNYIYLCQENPDYFKFDNLRLLAVENDHKLPNYSLYTGHTQDISGDSSGLSQDEIIKLFDYNRTENHSRFVPPLEKKSKLLFRLTAEPTDSEATAWGQLILPIDIFEIHDIVDLVLASLQCIFKNDYVITRCRNCNSFFVRSNRRYKYCPLLPGKEHGCYYAKRQQRRMEKESSEAKRMEHSVRSMMANRYDMGYISEGCYEIFKKRNKECNRRIDDGLCTDEQHMEWLKQFYKRKYL